MEAGSYQDFTVTCTAGYFGVDDTGGVKICWRYAADPGTPQFDRQFGGNRLPDGR